MGGKKKTTHLGYKNISNQFTAYMLNDLCSLFP